MYCKLTSICVIESIDFVSFGNQCCRGCYPHFSIIRQTTCLNSMLQLQPLYTFQLNLNTQQYNILYHCTVKTYTPYLTKRKVIDSPTDWGLPPVVSFLPVYSLLLHDFLLPYQALIWFCSTFAWVLPSPLSSPHTHAPS